MSSTPGTSEQPNTTPAAPPEQVRFDHAARVWGVSRRRSVVAAVTASAGMILAGFAVLALARWLRPDLGVVAHAEQLVVALAAGAVGLPIFLAVVRWVERRPVGSVWSVSGRVRPGWSALCVGVAGVAVVAMMVAMAVVALVTGNVPAAGGEVGGWVGAGRYLGALAVVMPLVLAQVAAEEVLFRGVLLQAAGRWFQSMWPPILIQAVLFAAAHGAGSGWGSLAGAYIGVVLGWLAVRTGSLEAGVALHLAVNGVPMLVLFAVRMPGPIALDSVADTPLWALPIQPVAVTGYAALVFLLGKALRVRTTTTDGRAAGVVPAAPAGDQGQRHASAGDAPGHGDVTPTATATLTGSPGR